ncbi:hypothetical protein B4U80_13218 [Leptotrombidium deliense]|uniref:PWWP domain-containing protein n=1 Tax=Leptotrombidium deliense TaxID=299467 RepID=A0A443SAB6_9ACAR|nr:hypothetical protein B4U80_13218 [Leptotrombidium deliense]
MYRCSESVLTECFKGAEKWNSFLCHQCLLFQHKDCVKKEFGIDSCIYCFRRSIERGKNVGRFEVNDALKWVLWHIQDAVGVQMKLLNDLVIKAATWQFTTSEDFIIFLKQRICSVFTKGKVDRASVSVYREMHKIAMKEVKDFQRCKDCFQSRHRFEEFNEFWISNVCSKPHLLVYAKVPKFPLWPAKVLDNRPNKEQLFCRFFGTKDECWVSAEKCYLLSEEYPGKTEPKVDKSFLQAKEELEKHVQNLISQFPSKFRFPPVRHAVNAKALSLFEEPLFCNEEVKDLEFIEEIKRGDLNEEIAMTEEFCVKQEIISTLDTSEVNNSVVDNTDTDNLSLDDKELNDSTANKENELNVVELLCDLKPSYNSIEEAEFDLKKQKKKLFVNILRLQE